jgi:hypothetical protein
LYNNTGWFWQKDVYVCAVFSVLGLLFLLLPLRGRPLTRAVAKGFVVVGPVIVMVAVVESLISQAALYGGDCSHSLISIVFAHACPDWFTNPVHLLFLELVIPAAVGVVLLLVGVSMLRSANGNATHRGATANRVAGGRQRTPPRPPNGVKPN